MNDHLKVISIILYTKLYIIQNTLSTKQKEYILLWYGVPFKMFNSQILLSFMTTEHRVVELRYQHISLFV